MSEYDREYYFRPSPRRPSPHAALWPVLALILIIVIGLVWWLVPSGQDTGPLLDPDAEPPPVAAKGEYTPEEKARIQLFQEAKDSVVNVDTLAIRRDFDFRLVELQQGTGSGFIWPNRPDGPPDGYIVTNFHVIADALRRSDLDVRVTLADHSGHNARLVGAAPEYDLAVLQINTSKTLKAIKVGSSADLQVGQDAYAIGNPFGQELTFTNGIVSALDRQIMSPADVPIAGVIQTNAAINPGNSGGPLLDRWGRLIGVNSAITSPSGGFIGIGYAIPVDTVREVVTQLIRQGRVPRPSLGIMPLREQFTRDLGFENAVIIQDVRPNGPADQAGLEGITQSPRTGRWTLGDVILEVDGEEVSGVQDLNNQINKHKPGDTVTLTVQRGAELRKVEVTLEGV